MGSCFGLHARVPAARSRLPGRRGAGRPPPRRLQLRLTELTQGHPLPLCTCPLPSGMSCGDRSQGASGDLQLPRSLLAGPWVASWPACCGQAAGRLPGPAARLRGRGHGMCTLQFPGACWDTLQISHQFRAPNADAASSAVRAGGGASPGPHAPVCGPRAARGTSRGLAAGAQGPRCCLCPLAGLTRPPAAPRHAGPGRVWFWRRLCGAS